MVEREIFFLVIVVEDIKSDHMVKKLRQYLKRRAQEHRSKLTNFLREHLRRGARVASRRAVLIKKGLQLKIMIFV